MLPFANILMLAAVTLLAPERDATVPLLGDAQREHLAKPQAERLKLLGEAGYRRRLAEGGAASRLVRLAWADDGATTNADRVALVVVQPEGAPREIFAVTNRTEVSIANLEPGRRYNWGVRIAGTQDGAVSTFVAADELPRLLRIDGVANVRDLGGWKGLGGRRVRMNRIFRSAALRGSARKTGGSLFSQSYSEGPTNITASALDYLEREFKIKTDIELRTPAETIFLRSSLLGENVKWAKISFAAYQYIDGLVRGREPFARVFRHFTDESSYPILFHCSGGRDRTGTLAFVLNGLLGVSEDDLCRDWEASAFCNDDLKFGPYRIEGLIKYLKTMGGRDLTEDCELFARSCGIRSEDIEKFRALMLEGGAE